MVACSSSDNVATDDDNELNEGIGALERDLLPPLDAPTSDRIGAKTSDVLAALSTELSPEAAKSLGDGCNQTNLVDGAKKVVVEHVVCKGSEVVRLLAANGTTAVEHADLNRDGKIDRFSDVEGTVAQYRDVNFDGRIDVVIERVERVEDFSIAGYERVFPKSAFLYRIREDRNRDGKLDLEKLTARGALPKE